MEGEENNAKNMATEMTANEIIRIARIAVELGISRVKLTGGEPLMRKDITEIVKGIASISGLRDLAMTTNGTMLAFLAKELHANGLKRVNISLSSINSEVYNKITGGKVEYVLNGVKASVEAGLCPVKINMLVLKSINDLAISEMIEFARETRTILQLIELEPINIDKEYYSMHYKPLDEYEAMLKQRAVKIEARRFMQNRHIYHLPDATVEIVHPTENSEFCMHCTRLRITSDGKLKPCLMRNDNLIDILTPMRNGASDDGLMELFKLANQKRQPYNKE
jgi:cyclic pyranopterin phosphate synthase